MARAKASDDQALIAHHPGRIEKTDARSIDAPRVPAALDLSGMGRAGRDAGADALIMQPRHAGGWLRRFDRQARRPTAERGRGNMWA